MNFKSATLVEFSEEVKMEIDVHNMTQNECLGYGLGLIFLSLIGIVAALFFLKRARIIEDTPISKAKEIKNI